MTKESFEDKCDKICAELNCGWEFNQKQTVFLMSFQRFQSLRNTRDVNEKTVETKIHTLSFSQRWVITTPV